MASRTLNIVLAGRSKGAQSALKTVGKTAAVVGAGIVAAFAGIGYAAQQSLQKFDDIGKASSRLGLSTTAVQQLGFAAEQTGSNFGTVERGITRLASSLDDARFSENSPAARTLAALNLEIDDLANKSPEQQLHILADAIAGVEDPSLRSAYAQDLFGRSGAMLLPLLENGSAGLTRYGEKFDATGGLISERSIRMAEATNDAFNRIKQSFTAVRDNLTVALLPTIQRMQDMFESRVVPFIINHVIPAVQKFAGVLGTAFDALSKITTTDALVVGGLVAIAGALVVLPALFTAVAGTAAAAWVAIGGPIGLVVIALIAAGVAIYKFRDQIRNGLLDAAKFVVDWASGVTDTFLGWGESLVRVYNNTAGRLLGKIEVDFDGMRENVGRAFDGVIAKLESWKATTDDAADESSQAIQQGAGVSVEALQTIDAAALTTAATSEAAMPRVADAVSAMSTRVQNDALAAGSAIQGLYTAAQQLDLANLGFEDVASRGKLAAPTINLAYRSPGGGGGVDRKAEEDRRAEIADAKAEGRAQRLATNLELEGYKRDQFLQQLDDARRSDAALQRTDELAYYAREQTDADRVIAAWTERKRQQDEAQQTFNRMLEEQRRARDLAAKTLATTQASLRAQQAKSQDKMRVGLATAGLGRQSGSINQEGIARTMSRQAAGRTFAEQKAFEAEQRKSHGGTYNEFIQDLYGVDRTNQKIFQRQFAGFHESRQLNERIAVQSGRHNYIDPETGEVVYTTAPAISPTGGLTTHIVPKMATGGIVRARPGGILANIGEGRYDEAVIPLNGRQAGMVVNNYNTFVVDGDVYNIEDLRDQVLEWVNVDRLRGGQSTA